MRSPSSSYDAFISYSHAADGKLAPALQAGLQRLAKPWYRTRALHVFRDDTGLAVNADLWSSITAAMDAARYFILLCSPDAAASAWVNREIERWVTDHPVEHILPVLTEGTLEWDPRTGDYDAERSSALPPSLAGLFAAEPRHLDLRWAREEEQLDLHYSRFRAAVAELAAPLHGIEKDKLDSEEVRQHRRTRRVTQGALSVLTVLLVVAVVASGLAIANARTANEQRDNAERETRRARAASVSAEVERVVAEMPALLENDRSLAALLAVEAERLRPGPSTRGALLATLTQEPRLRFTLHGGRDSYLYVAPYTTEDRVAAMGRDGVDVWDLEERRLVGGFDVSEPSGLAVAPAGDLIAAGTTDGTVTFWDAELEQSGERVSVDGPVADLAFSPDGRTLAVAVGVVGDDNASSGHLSHLVDVVTRRPTVAIGGHTGGVTAVAFSADGRHLATGGNDATVLLHDAGTGATVGGPLSLDTGVLSVDFSPDSRLVAAGSFNSQAGRSAGVFDVATGARIPIDPPEAEGRTIVRFTRDGSHLAVASADGNVQLWSTTDFQTVGRPIETQHGPPFIASLPTAGFVVAGYDGTISAWEPGGSAPIAPVVPHSGPAGGRFSPDGSVLATLRDDDIVVLHRTDDLRRLRTLSAPDRGTRPNVPSGTPIAFRADSKVLALGDRHGRVHLFDVATGTAIGAVIQAGTQLITALEFSPDGRLLVATSAFEGQNGARVIDIENRTVRDLDPPLPFPTRASFSPDGTRLLVSSLAVGGYLFRISDGIVGPGVPLELEAEEASVDFSDDGALVAAGSLGGELTLLDGRTLRRLGEPIAVSAALALSVEFTPDGRFVVVEDIEGFAHLIDVEARRRLGEPFAGRPSGVGWPGASPDGRTLVLPGAGGSVLLALDVPRWRAAACERAGRSLTDAEWDRYLPSADPREPGCRGTRR